MKNLLLALVIFSAAEFTLANANQSAISTSDLQLVDDVTMNMRFTLAPTMLSQTNSELGYAVDFVLTDNFMLGPQLSYYKYAGQYSNLSYFGIGVNTTYSLTENFINGWFISTGLRLYSHNSSTYKSASSINAGIEAPEQNINATLMYGYKWFFSDNFNIRLSAGLQYNTNDTLVESMQTDNGYYEAVSSIRGSKVNFDSDLSIGLTY